MKFTPGQSVYVGWCPDQYAVPSSRHARCSIGRIVSGPHTERINNIRPPAYLVRVNGSEHTAHESILRPINDDSEVTETAAEATA